MRLFVSGLVNVETSLKIRSFPVTYYPIDYPFFGIGSTVSGVGFNIACAARSLGDEVTLASLIGRDIEAERICAEFDARGLSRELLFAELDRTPASVVLYEPGDGGRRQVYCDLKDIQEKSLDASKVRGAIETADICAICNINFDRALIPVARQAGKKIATDVHVLSDVRDDFNLDYMKNADILFLSDEDLPAPPLDFLGMLAAEYPAEVIVIGLGAAGAAIFERASGAKLIMPAVNIGGVENTVGAGDALFTAFLHYYSGCGAVEALKRAQVFAALKIRHGGGSRGFSTEAQVEEVYSSYKFG